MTEQEWIEYWSELLPEQMVDEAVAISMGDSDGCTGARQVD